MQNLNTMRRLIALVESDQWPASVTPGFLIHLMQRIHHSEEDFANGDINVRIWKFSRYVLRQLPVADLASDWALQDDLVADYARRMQHGEVPPPIIWDAADKEMIDGGHRLAAARIAGLKTFPAYVGLPEDIDPDWDIESDD